MAANKTDECYAAWYQDMGEKVAFIASYCMCPFSFAFGAFGHTICLVTFLDQRKKEKAYMHQIILTSFELLYVTVHSIFTLVNFLFTGGRPKGYPVYATCYWCMWLQARLFYWFREACTSLVPMCSIVLSLDRFTALQKSTNYKATTKRGYIIAIALCIVVSTATSIFAIAIYDLAEAENGNNMTKTDSSFITMYKMSPNYNTWRVVFASLRDVFRPVLLAALCFLNATIPYLYVKHLDQVKNILCTDEERRRRRTARTLTITSWCQSTFVTLAIACSCVSSLYTTIAPPCYASRLTLVGNVLTGAIQQFFFVANAYTIFIVSPNFRRTVVESIPILKKLASKISPISVIAPGPVQAIPMTQVSKVNKTRIVPMTPVD